MKLGNDIFAALKQMDEEATRLQDGCETGLRGYAAFRKGSYSLRGNRYEDAITDRLAELLRLRGYECEVRPRYPTGTLVCDLLVKGPGLDRMWIEVKGAWRNCIPDEDHNCYGAYPNSNFPKHLRAAAEDVGKVRANVAAKDASRVGMLLIGFDVMNHVRLSITDRDLKVVRLRASGWTEASAEWSDCAWLGGRVLCHFWWTTIQRVESTLREPVPVMSS